MADIVQFEKRKRTATPSPSPIIKKVVNGQTVECLDFEMLSPAEQSRLLTANTIAQSLKE